MSGWRSISIVTKKICFSSSANARSQEPPEPFWRNAFFELLANHIAFKIQCDQKSSTFSQSYSTRTSFNILRKVRDFPPNGRLLWCYNHQRIYIWIYSNMLTVSERYWVIRVLKATELLRSLQQPMCGRPRYEPFYYQHCSVGAQLRTHRSERCIY